MTIGASAGSDTADQTLEKLPAKVLLERMSGTRIVYIYKKFNQFRGVAGEDQVLEKKDIELSVQRLAATARASQLVELFRYDLNGDGGVTREEIETWLSGDVRSSPGRAEKIFQEFKSADLNADGVISVDEVIAFAKSETSKISKKNLKRRTGQLYDLLALDPNADGRLTANELEDLLRSAFAVFDLDGNGVLSPAENSRVKAATNDARVKKQERQRAALCELTEAAPGVEVVLIGAYESGSIATTSIAGQDRLTGTSLIEIEPGKTPLHIVAVSFRPMIWRLTGATERVTRFVAMAQPLGREAPPSAGVVGLARNVVSFVATRPCFKNFNEPKSGKARRARAVVENKLKRPVQTLVASYILPGARIPSGEISPRYPRMGPTMMIELGKGNDTLILGSKTEILVRKDGDLIIAGTNAAATKPPPGVDDKTFRIFNYLYPGGVIKVDASAVVAPVRAEDYVVLPEMAGLVQLIANGSIERLSDGYFLIKQPISRFPANLSSAYSVKFLLAKGVSLPAGKPSDVCVYSEETGKVLLPARKAGRNRC